MATYHDIRGLEVSAADPAAVEMLDRAISGFLGARTDTGDHLRAAQELDPDLVMGHVLRGYFMHLFAHRGLMARARDSLDAARDAAGRVGATSREQSHMAALDAWCDGRPADTLAALSDILIDHPLDIVALKLSEYWNFYTGEAAGMRDSVGRALHAWEPGVPDYPFVLGIQAFALEESGDYARAEQQGRAAVEANPADIWATHAVAHVMEMTERRGEGVAWLDGLSGNWDGCNNFALHVWWHRALFALELGRFDEAMELYDREVRAESTRDFRDITNAAALLWRIDQEGIDVGDRWAELAEHSAARVGEHVLVFADAHYMLALASDPDQRAAAAGMADSAAAYATRDDESQAGVMRAAGAALCRAILAYRNGDYGGCVDALYPVRFETRRMGGSHAQRDVFHQILIEAAIRAGRLPLARALLSERLQQKPRSMLSWRRYGGVLRGIGDGPGAAQALETARRLETETG
jgi:tetratricopeptide (TPR) repeat protein